MSSFSAKDGECPEMGELASWVEEHKKPGPIRDHVDGCDACEEAIVALEDEILSLQIPLSEIWFRDHVSCPPRESLLHYAAGGLSGGEETYLRFHVEVLKCPYCVARLGEHDVATSPEASETAKRSRRRTTEATSSLLEELKD